MKSTAFRFPSLLCLCAAVAVLATNRGVFAQQKAAETLPFKILYTGSLFGYYRMAPEEAPKNIQLLPPRTLFEKLQESPDALVLGMGDNFAPEFGASLQMKRAKGICKLDSTVGASKEAPESLYKTEFRNAPTVDCDNVANFLLRSGYRAIVPGREDFIYTATWLRRIAVEFRDYHSQVDGLRMLGANLRLMPASANDKKADGKTGADGGSLAAKEKPCPLLFSGKVDKLSPKVGTDVPLAPPEGPGCTSAGIPTLLDWLSRLDATLYEPGVQARIVEDARGNNSSGNIASKQLITNEQETLKAMSYGLYALDSDCHDVKQNDATGNQKKVSSLSNGKKAVSLSSHPCRQVNTEEQNDIQTYAEALSKSPDGVLNDASRVAGQRGILRAIWREQAGIGYTVDTKHNILIIGVVGKGTMAEISKLNQVFCMKERSSPTIPCGVGDLYQLDVVDPLPSVVAILRAAALAPEGVPKSVILMAQMAPTEAEELAAQVASSLRKLAREPKQADQQMSPPPAVTVVLSQADSNHATGNVTTDSARVAPVFTPVPAYSLLAETIGSDPVSKVEWARGSKILRNTPPLGLKDLDAKNDNSTTRQAQSMALSPGTPCPDSSSHSVGSLLLDALQSKFGNAPVLESIAPFDCNEAITLLLLKALTQAGMAHSASKHVPPPPAQKSLTALEDVALLPERDIWLDTLPAGYGGYEACDGEPKLTTCVLRVALDRVLWKGDYGERVMVKGSDLQAMLTQSAAKSSGEQTLAPQDAYNEWLTTYGIVTGASKNLTQSYRTSRAFSLPSDPTCISTAAATGGQDTLYCIDSRPVQADGSYWIVTSDHLADDKAIYPTLGGLPDNYHQTMPYYLSALVETGLEAMYTAPGTNQIGGGVLKQRCPSKKSRTPFDYDCAEPYQQGRSVFHMDFAKLVGAYNFAKAVNGDNYVANTFQGVNNTQASTPSSSELDLEESMRGYWRFFNVDFGVQNDLEYDRSVQGNLAGKPVNPSFPLNNFAVGPFGQWLFPHHSDRTFAPLYLGIVLPTKLYLIVTPEYQRQLKGSYLFFGFGGGAKGELTVPTQVSDGANFKAGLRGELGTTSKPLQWDAGSYSEVGVQYFLQRDVLSGLTLVNATQKVVCSARNTLTIADCVQNTPYTPINGAPTNTGNKPITVDASTSAAPRSYNSVNQEGLYWDVHLAKKLWVSKDKARNLGVVFETKGDGFLRRSQRDTLSTETLYDVPLSFAFSWQIVPNLSLTPTYTSFFYSNQLSENHLLVNKFNVSLRWYYDRDSSVPFMRQLLFQGPSTLDQTKLIHMK